LENINYKIGNMREREIRVLFKLKDKGGFIK
jgi:hypothetical protein